MPSPIPTKSLIGAHSTILQLRKAHNTWVRNLGIREAYPPTLAGYADDVAHARGRIVEIERLLNSKEAAQREKEAVQALRLRKQALKHAEDIARASARAASVPAEQRKVALSRLWRAFQTAYEAIRDDQENDPTHYRKHTRDIALATKTFLDEFDALFTEAPYDIMQDYDPNDPANVGLFDSARMGESP